MAPRLLPLALRILRASDYLIIQKELKKTKNTIKIGEFNLSCRKKLVFGARVPLMMFMYRTYMKCQAIFVTKYSKGKCFLKLCDKITQIFKSLFRFSLLSHYCISCWFFNTIIMMSNFWNPRKNR